MDKKIYLIGNAHLDPVWLWKRREGYAEIKATFQSALDRMEQFDDFVFSCSSAAYYQWVEKNEPAMFEKIKQRVAEGRWAIVGGMWVQPDCNMPSGEAFARQFLYSQRYFLEKFGRIATVGYNVDSFGHNGMLPQLLKKAGFDSYVFMRPGDEENKLPYLFDWESPDGSRVTTFRISCVYGDYYWGYTPEKYGSLSIYEAKVERVKEIVAQDGVPHMQFYGVGNHGGGPTVRCLEDLSRITANEPDIVYSSPMEYFDDIRNSGIELPLVQTDLQHHASGCYSAGSSIKKLNRLTENRLVSAEKYDVLAGQLTQHSSGKDTIKAAYEKLLFNQFHDILCGCCIEDALTEAERYFSAAWALGEDVAESALQKISWNINTSGGIKGSPSGKEDWILWESDGQGAPIVVFNPHSFPAKQLVQLNHGGIIGMTDEAGNPITIDYTRGQQSNGSDIYNTLFMADVPAYGYRTYYAYTKKKIEAPQAANLTVTETSLENDFLKVEFDRATGSFNLYDKKQDMQLVSGAVPVVMDDTKSDTWAHMIFSFNDQIGRFTDPTFEVINQGPLRATIRVTSTYNRSTLRQDFTLDCFSTKLSVKCRLDFHERRKVVKLSFPVVGECSQVLYEMPFGFIKKECNGQEEPGHRYVSMSGKTEDGRVGSIALLNDGKYSFSAQNNTMYMMIARGCGYADHFWYHNSPIDYMDQGKQEFCYELLPHTGESLAGVTKSAMLLNQPLEHVMETNHDGALDRTYSGISISADNVVCETIKHAETEDALVLRIYETAGEAASADVTLRLPSYEADFALSFGKHEVKTVMVFQDGTIKEVNLIEL